MKATLYHRGAHLSAEDLYEATERCPACLAVGVRRPVYRVQNGPAIDMLKCDHCGACSASSMPKPAVLEKYYGEYYVDTNRKTTTPDPVRFARHMLKAMAGLKGKDKLRILDFGGGDGAIAAAAAVLLRQVHPNTTIAIDVVDYEKPGEYGADGIVLNGFLTLDDVAGPYDIIVASAILEHIPEVNEIIRKLGALAGSGTYFYARTPFILPMAKIFRKIDMTYPAHVHDMGSHFWNRLPATFDLKADIVRSSPSIVESAFSENPGRAIAATLMKIPAQLELLLWRPGKKAPAWEFVGGWEIVLRFR